MSYLIDDNETEKTFQQILALIKLHKNGEISEMMRQKGVAYKMNWGASIIDLRDIARQFEPNHLLALKLWNKQWRETMILATMLDDPKQVSEEQMDFWTKSFENTEIAEQASANLWVKTRFAFIKAIEWCRGKKHIAHFTGLHLIGRLASTDKLAIDEMFEPFFEELPTLAKDKNLHTVFYRSALSLGTRSEELHRQTIEMAQKLLSSEADNTQNLGKILFEELNSEYVLELVKKQSSPK